MANWFDNKTPRDALERAKRAYDRFYTDTDAQAQIDLASQCAEAIWHVRDWLWLQTDATKKTALGWSSKKNYEAWLDAQSGFATYVRHAQDMANGAKHSEITMYPPYMTETVTSANPAFIERNGLYFDPNNPDRFILVSGVALKVISRDGLRHDVEPILRHAIDAWESILTSLGY